MNQSLVLSLFLVQHFSLLKLVSNISTSFFDFQEFLSELSHILTFYQYDEENPKADNQLDQALSTVQEEIVESTQNR